MSKGGRIEDIRHGPVHPLPKVGKRTAGLTRLSVALLPAFVRASFHEPEDLPYRQCICLTSKEIPSVGAAP
jgi:hypothetical protein